MLTKWVTTSAIALVIGTGAVFAQSPDQPQKHEEGSRTQTPSKDAEKPAGEHMKGRAEQGEPKAGAKETQRGEAASPTERKQAQEPSRDTKEPTKQSQEQGRSERPATAQQKQEEQKGHDAKQATEQQRAREGQKDEHAQDTKRPADTKQTTEQKGARDQKDEHAQDQRPDETKQQQSQQQQERDRKDQAAQPSGTSTQQANRPGETGQGQRTGQAADQSGRRSANLNDNQRKQVVDRLQRDRSASSENLNIRVDVGERLPPRVRPRPLPPDIVEIAPEYRDYEYTVINNRVAIVDPHTREVVDVIDESGGGSGRSAGYSGESRERVVFSSEERQRLKELVRQSSTTVGTTSSGGGSGSTCLSLQPVPEELVRSHPELSNYRYLAIGDEAVLVDPQQQKIVQVID
jgi:hypothetical protein